MRAVITLTLFVLGLSVRGQNFKGMVADSNHTPLPGAIIYWENTEIGSVSDLDGMFEIPYSDSSKILVITLAGFVPKRFQITAETFIHIILKPSVNVVDLVEIKVERPSTVHHMNSVQQKSTITTDELKKAACCNLSESFETNPTVDVAFTDAVTGTKQIQLLGLAGSYALITSEQIPILTGNSVITGLELIPGQFLESIQLVKGTGSVINGRSSITGQINTQFKDNHENPTFVNLYINSGTRTEANFIQHIELTPHLESNLFAQYAQSFQLMDNNNDGFSDNGLGKSFVGMATLNFEPDSLSMESKSGVKYAFLDKISGQIAGESPYQVINKQNRIEAWNKTGFISKNRTGTSVGFQNQIVLQNHNLSFGTKILSANEIRYFSNAIYDTYLGNTNHLVRTALNYQYQDAQSTYENISFNLKTQEIGSALEYTNKSSEKFTFVGGFRVDYNTKWGLLLSPKIHTKFHPNDNFTLRFSSGIGIKNPNPLMENFGWMASKRSWTINNLTPEKAINSGISITQKLNINRIKNTLTADYYYTHFLNKTIVDVVQSARTIEIYNGFGKAHSFMVSWDAEINAKLNLTVAYRYYHLSSNFNNIGWALQPLSPTQRSFLSGSYKVKDRWFIDATIQAMGKSKLPFTEDNPTEFQLNDWSDAFQTLSSQIRFSSKKGWDFYIGGENILNYQQANPILQSENPSGDYFDAAMVWGPVFGRKIYAGLKWQLTSPKHHK